MSWKEKAQVILPLIRNKYVLTGLLFIIWLFFFDQNNMVNRMNLSRRINDLEKQKEHYKHEIDENRKRMDELKSNPENLEKFAREQYQIGRASCRERV